MFSELASPSAIRFASSGTPRLGVGRIADNHLTVNKHEGLPDKLEGFQSESIVPSGGGEELYSVINSTAVEEKDKGN